MSRGPLCDFHGILHAYIVTMTLAVYHNNIVYQVWTTGYFAVNYGNSLVVLLPFEMMRYRSQKMENNNIVIYYIVSEIRTLCCCRYEWYIQLHRNNIMYIIYYITYSIIPTQQIGHIYGLSARENNNMISLIVKCPRRMLLSSIAAYCTLFIFPLSVLSEYISIQSITELSSWRL